MIYAILFGLDFYTGLRSLLGILVLMSVVLFIASCFIYGVISDSEAVAEYKKDNTYEPDYDHQRTEVNLFKVAHVLYRKRYLVLALWAVYAFLPTSKTLYIASGIYAGQTIVEQVKGSPLANKAYQLAEKKLDELLADDNSSKTDKQ